MAEELLPFEKIKREIIVKKESESSPEFGINPPDRKTEDILDYGVINFDKPSGPTSHQAVDYLKGVLHIDKAGHSGTLDPAVTGVLPVAIGRATRIAQALLNAGKEYMSLAMLGK